VIQLNPDSIRDFSLDVSTDLMSLHIGDRILEVNGSPVCDQPVENIERLIQCSDQALQLTIEHDPDALSRRRCFVPPPLITREGSKSPPPEPSSPTANATGTSPLVQRGQADRERLFRRKDEASRPSRQLRRSRGSCAKERSSSTSRLLDGWVLYFNPLPPSDAVRKHLF